MKKIANQYHPLVARTQNVSSSADVSRFGIFNPIKVTPIPFSISNGIVVNATNEKEEERENRVSSKLVS